LYDFLPFLFIFVLLAVKIFQNKQLSLYLHDEKQSSVVGFQKNALKTEN